MSQAAPAPIDPAVMQAGKQQFLLCQACHGPEGLGIDMVGPPLAGSEWVNGPAENLIRIQLRGLQGPIKVKGKEYTFAVPMPAQPFQTDEQIAHVLTYVRNSFGNQAPEVTVAEVVALRSEVGKPPLTMANLVPPTPAAVPGAATTPAVPGAPVAPAPGGAPATAQTTTGQPAAVPEPYDTASSSGLPAWAWLLLLGWLALCLLPVLRHKE